MVYLADANFLIYCWRNSSQPDRLRSVRQYLESEIRITWLVKAEFLRGAVMANHDPNRVSAFLRRHETVWPDEQTLSLYAAIYASLVRKNQLIGPHDLWIAVSAVQQGLPLLTNNAAEFSRVEGITVVNYLA